MELVHAHQIPFEELLKENIDILIAACSNETRSRHLVQLSNFNAQKKIAFIIKENLDSAIHAENALFFRENGFECYELSGQSVDEIVALLEKISGDKRYDNIKLIVDYSSMSKMWYGTIISYFSYGEFEINKLTVYFCYTPEYFVPPAAQKCKPEKPEPVFSRPPSVNDNKPLALVVGLGYDEGKAEFLCDFFKPDDAYFFLPNPSFDLKYTEEAKLKNKKLLSNVMSSHLLHYTASNVEDIDDKLTALCLNLRLDYRTILISLGPKTFSLASFLLNARYPDVEVWNLFGIDHSLDLKPAGMPIVYKAILTNEDDIY
jgi:hypothetical protein